MTLLSKAGMESQKNGGHKKLEFAKEEEVRACVCKTPGQKVRGWEGRIRGWGQQELQMSGWFLLGNLKLVFSKQDRQSTDENIGSERSN